MSLSPFHRGVLTRDLPEDGLRAGDVGVLVEIYRDAEGAVIGYELEFFSASGATLAVVSVPEGGVRAATNREVLSARELTQARRH